MATCSSSKIAGLNATLLPIIGTMLMLSMPAAIITSASPSRMGSAAGATACKPEEQKRLPAPPGPTFGTPASSNAMSATLIPCSASGIAQPTITSPILAGSSDGACASTLLSTCTSRSSGRVWAPWSFWPGVFSDLVVRRAGSPPPQNCCRAEPDLPGCIEQLAQNFGTTFTPRRKLSAKLSQPFQWQWLFDRSNSHHSRNRTTMPGNHNLFAALGTTHQFTQLRLRGCQINGVHNSLISDLQ